MFLSNRPRPILRALRALIALAATAALLASVFAAPSAADLQGQIAAGQAAVSALKSQIAAQTAQINQTAGISGSPSCAGSRAR
jgi:hypothetical protein